MRSLEEVSKIQVSRTKYLPVSLLDRLLDCVDVERANAAKVDDFSLDTLFSENISSFHAVGDHLAVGHNRDVAAFPLNIGLANGEKEVVRHGFLGHGEGDTVHHLILKKHDRVRVPNGSLLNN